MSSISYSISFGGAPAVPEHTPRWLLDVERAYPLNGREWVIFSSAGTRSVVTADVWGAVQHCDRFRTLEGHASTLGERIPALRANRGDVVRILSTLAQQQVLIEDAAFLGRVLAEPAESPAPPAFLFIRTCDRPRLLRRLLKELLHWGESLGQATVVVLDDSRRAGDECEEIVHAIAREGLRARYYGARQQAGFCARIAAAVPDAGDLIDGILARPSETPSPGRLWNHALLLAAGERCLFMDDDALPQVFGGEAVAGLAWGQAGRAARFPQDAGIPPAGIRRLPLDPFRAHGQILGGTLGRFLAAYPREAALQALAGATAKDLRHAHRGAPLPITTNGIYGDPGTTSRHWLFDLDPDSLATLAPDANGYARNRERRQGIWQGRTGRLRLTPHVGLMTTTLTGVDNRSLLPPTLPTGRNEDYLFGAAVKFVYPDAHFVDLPWALVHDPQPPRQWHEDDLMLPVGLNPARMLGDEALRRLDGGAGANPDARCLLLSVLCLDLAEAGEADLRARMHDHLRYGRADLVRAYAAQREQTGALPDAWKHDLERTISTNLNALLAPNEDVSEAQMEEVRATAAAYGRLARAWPRLWAFCAGLPALERLP